MQAIQEKTAFAEKFLSLGFHATRFLLTGSLLAFLILAWLLTAPVFRCGSYLGDFCRKLDWRGKWS